MDSVLKVGVCQDLMWVINPNLSYLTEEESQIKASGNMLMIKDNIQDRSRTKPKKKLLLDTISNVYADLEKTDEDIRSMNENLAIYIGKLIDNSKSGTKDDSLGSGSLGTRSSSNLAYPGANEGSMLRTENETSNFNVLRDAPKTGVLSKHNEGLRDECNIFECTISPRDAQRRRTGVKVIGSKNENLFGDFVKSLSADLSNISFSVPVDSRHVDTDYSDGSPGRDIEPDVAQEERFDADGRRAQVSSVQSYEERYQTRQVDLMRNLHSDDGEACSSNYRSGSFIYDEVPQDYDRRKSPTTTGNMGLTSTDNASPSPRLGPNVVIHQKQYYQDYYRTKRSKESKRNVILQPDDQAIEDIKKQNKSAIAEQDCQRIVKRYNEYKKTIVSEIPGLSADIEDREAAGSGTRVVVDVQKCADSNASRSSLTYGEYRRGFRDPISKHSVSKKTVEIVRNYKAVVPSTQPVPYSTTSSSYVRNQPDIMQRKMDETLSVEDKGPAESYYQNQEKGLLESVDARKEGERVINQDQKPTIPHLETPKNTKKSNLIVFDMEVFNKMCSSSKPRNVDQLDNRKNDWKGNTDLNPERKDSKEALLHQRSEFKEPMKTDNRTEAGGSGQCEVVRIVRIECRESLRDKRSDEIDTREKCTDNILDAKGSRETVHCNRPASSESRGTVDEKRLETKETSKDFSGKRPETKESREKFSTNKIPEARESREKFPGKGFSTKEKFPEKRPEIEESAEKRLDKKTESSESRRKLEDKRINEEKPNLEKEKIKPSARNDKRDITCKQWDPLKSRYGKRPGVAQVEQPSESASNPFSPFSPNNALAKPRQMNFSAKERDPAATLSSIFEQREKAKGKKYNTHKESAKKSSSFTSEDKTAAIISSKEQKTKVIDKPDERGSSESENKTKKSVSKPDDQVSSDCKDKTKRPMNKPDDQVSSDSKDKTKRSMNKPDDQVSSDSKDKTKMPMDKHDDRVSKDKTQKSMDKPDDPIVSEQKTKRSIDKPDNCDISVPKKKTKDSIDKPNDHIASESKHKPKRPIDKPDDRDISVPKEKTKESIDKPDDHIASESKHKPKRPIDKPDDRAISKSRDNTKPTDKPDDHAISDSVVSSTNDCKEPVTQAMPTISEADNSTVSDSKIQDTDVMSSSSKEPSESTNDVFFSHENNDAITEDQSLDGHENQEGISDKRSVGFEDDRKLADENPVAQPDGTTAAEARATCSSPKIENNATDELEGNSDKRNLETSVNDKPKYSNADCITTIVSSDICVHVNEPDLKAREEVSSKVSGTKAQVADKPERHNTEELIAICKKRVCKIELVDIFWKAKKQGKFKKSRINKLIHKFMKKYNAKLKMAKALVAEIGGASVAPPKIVSDEHPSGTGNEQEDNDDIDGEVNSKNTLKSKRSKVNRVFSDSEEEGLKETQKGGLPGEKIGSKISESTNRQDNTKIEQSSDTLTTQEDDVDTEAVGKRRIKSSKAKVNRIVSDSEDEGVEENKQKSLNGAQGSDKKDDLKLSGSLPCINVENGTEKKNDGTSLKKSIKEKCEDQEPSEDKDPPSKDINVPLKTNKNLGIGVDQNVTIEKGMVDNEPEVGKSKDVKKKKEKSTIRNISAESEGKLHKHDLPHETSVKKTSKRVDKGKEEIKKSHKKDKSSGKLKVSKIYSDSEDELNEDENKIVPESGLSSAKSKNSESKSKTFKKSKTFPAALDDARKQKKNDPINKEIDEKQSVVRDDKDSKSDREDQDSSLLGRAKGSSESKSVKISLERNEDSSTIEQDKVANDDKPGKIETKIDNTGVKRSREKSKSRNKTDKRHKIGSEFKKDKVVEKETSRISAKTGGNVDENKTEKKKASKRADGSQVGDVPSSSSNVFGVTECYRNNSSEDLTVISSAQVQIPPSVDCTKRRSDGDPEGSTNRHEKMDESKIDNVPTQPDSNIEPDDKTDLNLQDSSKEVVDLGALYQNKEVPNDKITLDQDEKSFNLSGKPKEDEEPLGTSHGVSLFDDGTNPGNRNTKVPDNSVSPFAPISMELDSCLDNNKLDLPLLLPLIENVTSEIDKSLIEIESTPNTLLDESDASDDEATPVPFLKNLSSFLTDLSKIGSKGDAKAGSIRSSLVKTGDTLNVGMAINETPKNDDLGIFLGKEASEKSTEFTSKEKPMEVIDDTPAELIKPSTDTIISEDSNSIQKFKTKGELKELPDEVPGTSTGSVTNPEEVLEDKGEKESYFRKVNVEEETQKSDTSQKCKAISQETLEETSNDISKETIPSSDGTTMDKDTNKASVSSLKPNVALVEFSTTLEDCSTNISDIKYSDHMEKESKKQSYDRLYRKFEKKYNLKKVSVCINKHDMVSVYPKHDKVAEHPAQVDEEEEQRSGSEMSTGIRDTGNTGRPETEENRVKEKTKILKNPKAPGSKKSHLVSEYDKADAEMYGPSTSAQSTSVEQSSGETVIFMCSLCRKNPRRLSSDHFEITSTFCDRCFTRLYKKLFKKYKRKFSVKKKN